MKRRSLISLLVLAACIAAALVFRRFAFVAWYPVAVSLAVSLAFALSLRARPLCLVAAERFSHGVLPPGGEAYARRLTAVWAAWLALNAAIAAATVLDLRAWTLWNCCLSYAASGLLFLVETRVRARRFAVTFHTSGSTAAPKTIVKQFPELAREVAFHRDRLRAVLADRPVFLATIEPQHLYGTLWRVLLPKAAGCPVDPDVILTPEALLAKMRAAERVFLVTTPSFLDRFCAYADQYDVPQNTVEIVTSGALLTAETSAAARRVFGVAPREIFGSTETGGVADRRQSDAAPDAFDWHVFAPVRVARDAAGHLVARSPFAIARPYTMGDGVELAPDERRFKLLGRLDRLVKIAEQRVSLPEMEEKMRALPEVRDAALAVLDSPHGPVLGAVVVPAAAPAGGKRAAARALRARLRAFFPKGTVPKKYRFVFELPRNAQGKVRAQELREILTSNLVEPFTENVARAENAFAADVTFDADAPYFAGHFPGFPVLPGVVQLGLAQTYARRVFGEARALKTVKKMKFSRAVLPGERIRFTLEKKSDNEFVYTYQKGERLCSSAVLCF